MTLSWAHCAKNEEYRVKPAKPLPLPSGICLPGRLSWLQYWVGWVGWEQGGGRGTVNPGNCILALLSDREIDPKSKQKNVNQADDKEG